MEPPDERNIAQIMDDVNIVMRDFLESMDSLSYHTVLIIFFIAYLYHLDHCAANRCKLSSALARTFNISTDSSANL